jgi:acyl-CoA synthetase (AMP-forming)/AMP-acid ligase II
VNSGFAAPRSPASTWAPAACWTATGGSLHGIARCSTTKGYLFIEGRSDDTIIRGAENIAPAEIEDVLFQHPAVEDVAVTGIPDEEWGQRIAAAVVLAPGASATPDELREFARQRLRSARTPDEIVMWTELPYTETGKLLRRQIAARLIQP